MRSMVLSVALALLCGCGPKLIPGLEIELSDTPDHRAVLKLLEAYRKAFVDKNVEGLASLCSSRFFEDAGTASTADDFNRDGLRDHFAKHFETIQSPSLDLHLKRVAIEGDKAQVDYRYVARYRMTLPAGDKWVVTDDVKRMELVREDGSWKILSGI